jgi:hypothetical protein
MKVTIDRFENGFAVCENENKDTINIKRDKLPSDAHEGDILIIDGDKISIDKPATAAQKTEIENLMKELWK